MIKTNNLLIFLVIFFCIEGCACIFTHIPNSLRNMPNDSLVVVVRDNIRFSLHSIDDFELDNVYPNAIFVSPGTHKYTFKVDYYSPIYCTGSRKGQRAHSVLTKDAFGTSSVSIMKGLYSMEVTANKGKVVRFYYKYRPYCKYNINDVYEAVVLPDRKTLNPCLW